MYSHTGYFEKIDGPVNVWVGKGVLPALGEVRPFGRNVRQGLAMAQPIFGLLYPAVFEVGYKGALLLTENSGLGTMKTVVSMIHLESDSAMNENKNIRKRVSPPKWILRPQMLVALSALLLSLCGLFISFYEASLIRQAQRASTWPYVEVGYSLRNEKLNLWVRNTGVGPARIQAAAVMYQGKLQENWRDLMRRVYGEKADSLGFDYSLINGSVLPPTPERHSIFSLTEGSRGADREMMNLLIQAILEGAIDVTVCYSSVYDECWTSSLQNVHGRSSGNKPAEVSHEIKGCDSAQRSGI